MTIIEKIAHWRELALRQNTTLDRVYLWRDEYIALHLEVFQQLPTFPVEPGFKGLIMDIPLYVRKPLDLTFWNDPGQMIRECA